MSSIDASVSDFHYHLDMQVEPPVSSLKADNDYFTVRIVKDEDVVLDPVEGLKVVENNVCSIVSRRDFADYCYGYKDFKKALQGTIKEALSHGSQVSGHAIVKEGDGGTIFRLRVEKGKVVAEEGRQCLRWPDGSISELPN